MKKYFCLLCTVAALGCLGMTSCSKDKTTDTPADEPDPVTATVEFLAAMLEGQDSYVDQSFALEVDGQNVNLTFSQMQEVTDESAYPIFFGAIKDNLVMMEMSSAPFKVYKYSCGTLAEGKTVTCGTVTYTPRADRPEKETVDILDAFSLIADGGTAQNQINAVTFAGVYNDSRFAEFCELRTTSMGFSYTVR